jgi:hypothetical protein
MISGMTESDSSRHPSRRTFLATTAAALVAPDVLTRRLDALVPAPELSLQPLLARPTASSILINARNGQADVTATVQLWESGTNHRLRDTAPLRAAPGDWLEWTIDGLKPGTRYTYAISLASAANPVVVAARGGFLTQRVGHESFTAALITDPHTGTFQEGSPELRVMDDVVRNVQRDAPEFVIGLGDNVAWATSRNAAQMSAADAERAYDMYRRHTGPLTASTPHFSLLGNWEGETGKFPPESVALVRGARHRFLPNPDHRTYPQGGSAEQDYYAFTWGPALFVILNVQGYTKASTPLTLPTQSDVSKVEDWTLGAAQLAWLERTLKESSAPFKFLCIHHTVGGDAGNPHDTLYGRGGARAAHVGEQRTVHALMREHGVQVFFYGHDHVFVDDVVDGIHYALPGSFGAPWHFGPQVTGYGRFWSDSGHARLSVSPREARVEYINQAGAVFHAFSVAPR